MKIAVEVDETGRVRKHLTAARAQDTQTLCGVSFIWGSAGSVTESDGEPDCVVCLAIADRVFRSYGVRRPPKRR